jgi:hypothetical protein
VEFIVLGWDGTDDKAHERRLAAREAHLAKASAWFETGHWLYAAGILDDDGRMIGSMIVADFPSQDAMEAQWLDSEPYVLGKVWERVEVHRAQPAPFATRAGTG